MIAVMYYGGLRPSETIMLRPRALQLPDEGWGRIDVNEADISKTLKGKNLKVEPEMVRLEGMIKQCGLYEVDLNLGYDITSKVKVMVVPQKQ